MFVITDDWALVSHRLHLVKYAIAGGNIVSVVAKSSKFRAEIETTGANFYCWSLVRGSTNLAQEIKAIWELKTFIKHFQPQIIHAVALKPIIYSGLLCKIFKDIRLIAAMGGVGFVFTSNKIKAKLLKFPIKNVLKWVLENTKSRLILQNVDNIKMFERLGITKANTAILVRGSGVEIDKFFLSPMPNGIPLVILPARLLRDKGIFEFVEVASRLQSQGLKSKFVLVGDIDKDNPESLEIEIIQKWVDSGVIEHWRRTANMANVYKKATIVCLPSYAEGLPKALLEAASCGRPIISFDVPGCREIVKHNVNGKLVEFQNISELEKSVKELLLDKKKCSVMGQNGRKLVEMEFSDIIVNSKISDIWHENDQTNF